MEQVSSLDVSIVETLRTLVQQNEPKLIAGELPLCLTPEVLKILLRGFERLTSIASTTAELPRQHQNLEYLQKVFSRAKSLRLTHGGVSTIKGPVDLSRFHDLKQLDVKRLPPHWLTGLGKLRVQLVTLRISRSMNWLEDVLGRDAAGTFNLPWSALQKLYLSNNFIKELDDSLKLVPTLEVLDLSHNYLSRTAHYLQHLKELRHVNLAYNSLSALPQFSSSTNRCLRTLILRGNHLESLAGLEVVECLEVLDVSYNILCEHVCLLALRSLTSLKEVYVAENPIVNHRRHRVLTAAALSPKVRNGLLLDAQALTEEEIKSASSIQLAAPPPSDSSQSGSSQNSRRSIRNMTPHIADILEPTCDAVDSAKLCGNQAVVDKDLVENVTAAPLPQTVAKTALTKATIETLRKEFGESWLQIINGGFIPIPQTHDTTHLTVSAAIVATQPPIDGTMPLEEKSTSSTVVASQSIAIESPSVYQDCSSQYGSFTDSLGQSFSTFNENKENAFEHDLSNDLYIVKRMGDDSEEFFIEISDLHIIEKKLDGITLEVLELSILARAYCDQQDFHAIIHLYFDYMRKDRRERHYIMEDDESARKLLSLLQPIIVEQQAAGQHSDRLECLKCGKIFDLKAIRQRRHKSTQKICPHCNSDLVVEQTPTSGSVHSTVYGSILSGSSVPAATTLTSEYSKAFSTSTPVTTPKKTSPLREECSALADTETMQESHYLSANQSPSMSPKANQHKMHTGAEVPSSDDPTSAARSDEYAYSSAAEDNISYGSTRGSSASPAPSVSTENDSEITITKDLTSGLKFSRTDLTYIDHRLKLLLTLTYLGQDEEIECLLKAKCVVYGVPEEFPLILIITSENLLWFKVLLHVKKTADLSSRLELIDRQPLQALRLIGISLSHQNVRLEYEKVGYCVLLRDEQTGKVLHRKITELVRTWAFKMELQLEKVTNMNQEYYQQIQMCLRINHIADAQDDDDYVTIGEFTGVHYLAAFQKTSPACDIETLTGCRPISLVIDGKNLYILKENYHLPLQREVPLSAETYFTFLSQLSISDIAHLKVLDDRTVDTELFDAAVPFAFSFLFSTPESLENFIALLQPPWKLLYGVELQVTRELSSSGLSGVVASSAD